MWGCYTQWNKGKLLLALFGGSLQVFKDQWNTKDQTLVSYKQNSLFLGASPPSTILKSYIATFWFYFVIA